MARLSCGRCAGIGAGCINSASARFGHGDARAVLRIFCHLLGRQSTIAIGSGGLIGKGWLNGSQAHLEFIPERTTDFIFAVFSEEFGLLGNAVLLVLYLMLIGRGLLIAANAPTLFSRLLAGAITLSIFVYAFVNMGMVSGILPVVGVPLPFMSYGGTAFVTLSLAVGTLMSIQRHRKLVQT